MPPAEVGAVCQDRRALRQYTRPDISSAPLLFGDDDVPGEGGELEDRAAVAVDAADSLAPSPPAGITRIGAEVEVRTDRAAEGRRLDFEAGRAAKCDRDVAGMGAELVAPAPADRPAEADV